MARQLSRRAVLRRLAGVAAGSIVFPAFAPRALEATTTGDVRVEQIAVSQATLARGNRFTVSASITGVFRTASVTYAVPGGGRMTQFFRPTYSTNYETTFMVAPDAPVGEYRLDALVLRDERNAVVRYLVADDPTVAPLLMLANVRVTTDGNPNGLNPPQPGQPPAMPLPPLAPATDPAPPPPIAPISPGDPTAPQFLRTMVSQTSLAYGNAFTLRVVMRGPVGTARVTYAYPGGDITRSLTFAYASGDEAHYEATIRVSGDLPPGRYVITRLLAEGTNGTITDLLPPASDPLIAGSGVDVYGSQPPPPPPSPAPAALPLPTAPPPSVPSSPITFTAVAVSPTTVRPGELFTVTATIADSAGTVVGQPVVSFSDGKRELFAFFVRGTDGTYRATVAVSQYYPEGAFLLTRLYAYDDRGNTVNVQQPATAAFRADVTVRR